MNLAQATAYYHKAYENAIWLAIHIDTKVPSLRNLELTGHSLGGGFASAAAVSTRFFHADTFNAAGFAKQTLINCITKDPRILSDAISRFDDLENPKITSYQVYGTYTRTDGTRDAPDLLSFVQRNLNHPRIAGADIELLQMQLVM